MRKILYIFVFIAVACKTTPTESSKNSGKNMSFETIAQGALYGDGEEGIAQSNLVIKSEVAWNALVKKMDAGNKVSTTFKEVPVDFSKEVIICIFDKVRSTGGISISVTEIKPNKKDVSVTYVVKKPSKNGMATTVMTQPYHIVKTAKRKEDFIFRNSEEK